MVSIVISGPESTGKSTLTSELSSYFGCKGVQEYARDYCARLNRKCTVNDIETIARRQIIVFKKLYLNENLVIFDTYLEITKVWLQEVHGYCPGWLHECFLRHKPSFALLCAPDIAWQPDPLRQNPGNRDYLYSCYKAELDYYQIPWKQVSGSGTNRTRSAIEQVCNFINMQV